MSQQRLAEIENKIAEKPVFVISKSYCPFCNKAKQVLRKYNIKPENIEIMEIDNDKYCNEIQVKYRSGLDYLVLRGLLQELMAKKTGGRSVPRVFVGGQFLGGGDQTEEADRSGELAGLLEAAGAV